MKQKLSITIDEAKVRLIERLLEEGRFRNKSHILEYSLNRLLNEDAQKSDLSGTSKTKGFHGKEREEE